MLSRATNSPFWRELRDHPDCRGGAFCILARAKWIRSISKMLERRGSIPRHGTAGWVLLFNSFSVDKPTEFDRYDLLFVAGLLYFS
jgi:hypothetical protein